MGEFFPNRNIIKRHQTSNSVKLRINIQEYQDGKWLQMTENEYYHGSSY